jgi:hypothetical protein
LDLRDIKWGIKKCKILRHYTNKTLREITGSLRRVQWGENKSQ